MNLVMVLVHVAMVMIHVGLVSYVLPLWIAVVLVHINPLMSLLEGLEHDGLVDVKGLVLILLPYWDRLSVISKVLELCVSGLDIAVAVAVEIVHMQRSINRLKGLEHDGLVDVEVLNDGAALWAVIKCTVELQIWDSRVTNTRGLGMLLLLWCCCLVSGGSLGRSRTGCSWNLSLKGLSLPMRTEPGLRGAVGGPRI